MKAFTLLLSLIACTVMASEVYKYKDSSGNVIYSDSKPETGEVDTITITPASNTYQSDNENQQAQDALLEQQQQKSAEQQANKTNHKSQKEQLRQAVKKAEKALKNAKVVREGDMFPIPSGGVRYSDQYKNRVSAAEAALKSAKNAYKNTP